MEIEKHFSPKTMNFKEAFLKGEVFRHMDGETVYMPLSERYEFNSLFNPVFNAINLENKKLVYFYDDEIVEPLKSKLIVENY